MKLGRNLIIMLILTLLLLFVAWYYLEIMVHGEPPFSLEKMVMNLPEFLRKMGPLFEKLKSLGGTLGRLLGVIGEKIKEIVDGIFQIAHSR